MIGLQAGESMGVTFEKEDHIVVFTLAGINTVEQADEAFREASVFA